MKKNRMLKKVLALTLMLALILPLCTGCSLISGLGTASHIRVDFDSIYHPETVTTFFTKEYYNRIDLTELTGLIFGDAPLEADLFTVTPDSGSSPEGYQHLIYKDAIGSRLQIVVDQNPFTQENGVVTGDAAPTCTGISYVHGDIYESELLYSHMGILSGFNALTGHISEKLGEAAPDDPIMVSAITQAEALMDNLAYSGYERITALRYDLDALKELNKTLNYLSAKETEAELKDTTVWYVLRYHILPDSLPAGANCPDLIADFSFDENGRLLTATLPPEIEFTPRVTMPAMSAQEAYEIVSDGWDTPDEYMVFDAEFLLLRNGRYVWRFYLARDATDRLSDEMLAEIQSYGFKGRLDYILPCIDAGDGDRYSPFNGNYLSPVISPYNMPELFK